MPEHATHWERVVGDGLIYDGPCIVQDVIFWPPDASDYADLYDGRDATSGEKFCRLECDVDETKAILFSRGVLFGRGIYVDGSADDVETTVSFVPL